MLVPCILLGIAFPLAGQARERLSHRFGSAVGDTLGLNTLGSILGSLLAGFVLIPSLGLQRGMLLTASLATAYGALVLGAGLLSRAWIPRWAAAMATAAAAAAAFLLPILAPPWELSLLGSFTNNAFANFVGDDGRIDVDGVRGQIQLRYFEEGRGSTVAVANLRAGRFLLVNGKIVASDHPDDLEHELLLGHLPVLLHQAPRSALVVGLGAGITLGGVAAHDEIERLVVVEIEPAVVDAAREFAYVNDAAVDAERLEIVFQDGRNFLKTTRERFDVITADPIHPWAYGAAYLFTNEYYDLARARLSEGGVMCQWLPAYELSPPDFKSVIATFAQSFEHVVVWLASSDVVLIGSDAPIGVDLERLSARLAQAAVQRQLALVGLETPLALLGGFAMDSGAVRSYVEGGIINTDDNLHLEFSAPLHIGVPKYQQLQNLRSVRKLRGSPETLLREVEPLFASRQEASAAVESYQRAKWSTLRASWQAGAVLFDVARRGEDPGHWTLLEQSNEQLRRVLEEAPDYGPARSLLARNLVKMAHLRISQGEPRRALPLALEAVRMAPDVAPARQVLGLVMGQLRRYDSAIEQLEMARRMRPQDWETHYLLGQSLAAVGRDGDAIAVLRQGLALKPDHREMKQRLDELWRQVHPAGRVPPAG
jgi:spermidine synthase